MNFSMVSPWSWNIGLMSKSWPLLLAENVSIRIEGCKFVIILFRSWVRQYFFFIQSFESRLLAHTKCDYLMFELVELLCIAVLKSLLLSARAWIVWREEGFLIMLRT